ncbi:three-Cys-motif partner protein TcmP [Nitrosomonas sp.]|uniref:three-Cys-motif partner protein TcmP n=1 Tax=Nitrosomonas sp. TaxID=42353 RepID=UPI0025E985AF|nr:three-Cys-motif partner protein TcmP [Nitrosomonas sp.]
MVEPIGGDNGLLPDEDELDNVSRDQHSFGGAWTLIKLGALEKYLAAFNTVLSKQSFTRLYIDAFAGTGRCDIKVDGENKTIDGSARRALDINPAFHKFCFIELHSKKLMALNALRSEHPGKIIEIIQDDANKALKTLCTQYHWRRERAVLFLDPFGMHVEWSTLETIAKTGAIDVWYLFPYAGLYRQATKNADALDADKEASLTRVLGTDEWRKVFYVQNPQSDMFGGGNGDVRDIDHPQMLKFVSKQLKTLFPAVTEPKILHRGGNSRNPSGPPLFALYFASSNPSLKAHGLATKIAKDILNSL